FYTLVREVYRVHSDLHSFPTRRSSDLSFCIKGMFIFTDKHFVSPHSNFKPLFTTLLHFDFILIQVLEKCKWSKVVKVVKNWSERSEEHTSELQSRFDLVCRLLLEIKNK